MTSSLDRKKLAKIAGLMTSGYPHEVSEAAIKATKMIKEAGSTWEEVIMGAPAQQQRPSYSSYPNQGHSKTTSRGDQRWDNFANEYPEEAEWMLEKEESFDFAASVKEAVRKYGRLTENQLAAVQKCIVRDKEYEAERAKGTSKDRAKGRRSNSRGGDDEAF